MLVLGGGSVDTNTLASAIAAVVGIDSTRIVLYNVTADGVVNLAYFQILDSSNSDISAMEAAADLYEKGLNHDPSFASNGLHVISVAVFTPLTTTTGSITTIATNKENNKYFWATIGVAVGLFVVMVLLIIVFICLRRKLRVANSYSIEQTFHRYKEDIVYEN